MLKRQTRLRREYLHNRHLQSLAEQKQAKKQEIQKALDSGVKLPKNVRQEAQQLTKEMFMDGEVDAVDNIDDEYATAGMADPKILITTSRSPSSRLSQFAKELRLVFPNSQRINRGGYVIKEIVEACRSNQVTDLIIVHEHRGVPDGLVVSHFPHGPTCYFTLHNVVLRHDIPDPGKVSEQYPHLIFDGFTSKLGKRVTHVLKHLFPVPKKDSKRIMTFSNQGDFVSFRHHVYYKVNNDIQLAEVGPRFEMRLFEIRLGTLDLTEADVEWKLKPYMRTAKKRDVL